MKRIVLILCALLFAACSTIPVNMPDGHGATGHDDSNTIQSLTSVNPASGSFGDANYPAQLYNSLSKEDAGRSVEYKFSNFVYNGTNATACLGGTGAGLIMTPTACVAYNAGLRGTEVGSITFANTSTTWVAMDENTSGNNAGLPNFTRVSGTHYLIDAIDVTMPAMVSDSQLLMSVVTSGGAITAVTDLRRTALALTLSAINTVTLYASQFGGSDGGAQMANAIAACPTGSSCIIDARDINNCTSTSNVLILRGGIDLKLPTLGCHFTGANAGIQVGEQTTFLSLPAIPLIQGVEIEGSGPQTNVSCDTPNNSGRGCIYSIGDVGITGGFNGLNGITGAIAVGATSFVDSSGDAANLVAGSRIIVMNFGPQPQNNLGDSDQQEWKTVASVAGSTVNVTEPFRQVYNNANKLGFWYRLHNRVVNTHIHDLTLSTTHNFPDIIAGLYQQYTENALYERIHFNMPGTSESAALLYRSFGLIFRDNVIEEQKNRSEFGHQTEAKFDNNIFGCLSTVSGVSDVTFDFATEWTTISNNQFDCPTNGMTLAASDNNVVIGNRFPSGNISSAGITLRGGISNRFYANSFSNVLVGESIGGGNNGVSLWTNAHVYAANTCVLDSPNDGFFFCTTLGGTSGGSQPTWVKTAGAAQPVDNTVLDWVCGGKYHFATNNVILDENVHTATRAYSFGVNTSTAGDVTNNAIDYDYDSSVGAGADLSLNAMICNRDVTNNRRVCGTNASVGNALEVALLPYINGSSFASVAAGCGTGATILGNAMVGQLFTGTTGAATCTISFLSTLQTGLTLDPICSFTDVTQFAAGGGISPTYQAIPYIVNTNHSPTAAVQLVFQDGLSAGGIPVNVTGHTYNYFCGWRL